MNIILVIPKMSQSRNQLDSMHWAERHRQSKIWDMEVKIIKARQNWEDRMYKQKVIITSYRKRKLDADNLSGGLKSCLDSLVKNKLLVDDRPEWVEIEYKQEIDSKNVRTTIEMETANDQI